MAGKSRAPAFGFNSESSFLESAPEARLFRSGNCRLRLFAQCGDPVLQRPQADPQHLGGEFAIAAHVIEGEFNVSLLEFREWLAWLEHDRALIAGCGPWLRAGADSESRRRKVSQPDQTLACHDGGSLQHVAQFPHIT